MFLRFTMLRFLYAFAYTSLPMELLTTEEAAERMGRSRRWVQSLIKRGKLRGELKGRDYLIRAIDVDRYEHQPAHRPSQNGTRRPSRPRKNRARKKAE
jgi:excisionase family DNA binding protein